MLFKLNHPVLDRPILVIVSSDGCLFVKAADIVRIMGYCQPRRKVLQTARLSVKNVISRMLKIPPSLAKTCIYSIEEAAPIARRFLNPEAFAAIFADSVVLVPGNDSVVPTVDPRRAGTVAVLEEGTVADEVAEGSHFAVPVTDFLRSFKSSTMEFFERWTGEHRQAKIHLPVFGHLDLEYAPREVKIFVGRQAYVYRRVGCDRPPKE